MSNDHEAPPSSQANTQMNSQQSILTENDFKCIAKAVKDILLDDLRKELKTELHMVVQNAISCHRLPTPKGHKQIIARFTHTTKRSALPKATKNIDSNNDLHGVSVSQDLTKKRGKVTFLARQAKRNGQIIHTSVWDGKIYVTDKSEKRHVVTTECELNEILEGHIVSDRNQTPMPNGGAGYIPMHPGFQMRSPYLMQHVPAMYPEPGLGGMNPQMMSTMPKFR